MRTGQRGKLAELLALLRENGSDLEAASRAVRLRKSYAYRLLRVGKVAFPLE